MRKLILILLIIVSCGKEDIDNLENFRNFYIHEECGFVVTPYSFIYSEEFDVNENAKNGVYEFIIIIYSSKYSLNLIHKGDVIEFGECYINNNIVSPDIMSKKLFDLFYVR